jgi:beta-1,4-mannosyltransferase
MTSGPNRPFSILAWPAATPANRYCEALYANMDGVRVEDFKPGWRMPLHVLRKRYDVFHIHWLERAFWRVGSLAILRAVAVTLLTAAFIKVRGGAIVWTAHDPVPHQMDGNAFARAGFSAWLWKTYAALLTRMLDGVILLSTIHRDVLIGDRPYLRTRPMALTPHPHFKGVYPNGLSCEEARNRLALPAEATVLLLLGAIRPYKNAEALIEAFRGLPDPRLRLVIAGQPESTGYATELKALAGDDARIAFHFDFVADDDLQTYLNASNAVVIPFRNATNSGSVALALSFARPVVVPDMPVFREVRDLVGDDWMRLMENTLNPAELRDAVAWIGQSRPPAPDLDKLDWPHIAAKTLAFFRSVHA